MLIDNVEGVDIIMLMNNLLEYSDNYYMTSRSLWNYYSDEVHDAATEVVTNYRKNNKTTASESFEYKTKVIGSTPDNNNRLDAEVVVPLKYLPLINC